MRKFLNIIMIGLFSFALMVPMGVFAEGDAPAAPAAPAAETAAPVKLLRLPVNSEVNEAIAAKR